MTGVSGIKIDKGKIDQATETRIRNVMVRFGFKTKEELAALSDQELLRMGNFGRKSLRLLRASIDSRMLERKKLEQAWINGDFT